METTKTKQEHWSHQHYAVRQRGTEAGIADLATALILLGIEISSAHEARIHGHSNNGYDIYPYVVVSSESAKVMAMRNKLIELLDEYYGYTERTDHMYHVSFASDEFPALEPICYERLIHERGDIRKKPKLADLLSAEEQRVVYEATTKEMEKLTAFLKKKYLESK